MPSSPLNVEHSHCFPAHPCCGMGNNRIRQKRESFSSSQLSRFNGRFSERSHSTIQQMKISVESSKILNRWTASGGGSTIHATRFTFSTKLSEFQIYCGTPESSRKSCRSKFSSDSLAIHWAESDRVLNCHVNRHNWLLLLDSSADIGHVRPP